MDIKDDEKNLTERDYAEFLSAAGGRRLEILLTHAEINKKIIKIRKLKKMENFEKQNEEVVRQFEEFCKTKGLKAKFKVAFANMAESAHRQKEADKAAFEERKAKSAEENKDFVEFLHAKGLKTKIRLVIENIKKSAKENSEKAKLQREEAKALSHSVQSGITAENLSLEFNEYLKLKGLDGKYSVEITEE